MSLRCPSKLIKVQLFHGTMCRRHQPRHPNGKKLKGEWE